MHVNFKQGAVSLKLYSGGKMVKIGVTTSFEKINRLDSSYINHDYLNAVIENDAVPVLIPVTDNFEIIDRYLGSVDAILLTGGDDIDPVLYEEENSGLSRDVCSVRDSAEMYIVKKALEKGYPIMGICRGLQLLNVYFGGTLYQDISGQYGDTVKHANIMMNRDDLHHEVKLAGDSLIGRLFERERVMVNSRHHQGVKKPGDGLIVTAVADDGLIEAFEDAGRNILAVQWHPENITGVSKGCSLLFRNLVDRARKI